MTAQEVINEIKPLASDGYKKILLNHGVGEPCLGIKIEDLKKIQKRVKEGLSTRSGSVRHPNL
jgi:hypothetical protein